MSFSAEVLNVLIASPSDVEAERDEVEQAIYEWNRRYSEQLNVILLPRRWENDVVPAYRGSDPQQIINEQIVHKCDILVGVFWTKLGTPTLSHSSGTLEEIDHFIQSQKDVMLYFLEKPVPRSNTNYSEMERVDEFKRNYASKGIYSLYSVERIVDHLYHAVITRQTKSTGPTKEVFMPVQVNANDREEEIIDIEKLITGEILTDNEILLLTYSLHTGTRQFGERWAAEETTKNIERWISKNELHQSELLNYYSDVISNLAERGVLSATEYTSHGNPRMYSLSMNNHDRLRRLSSQAVDVIDRVMERYWMELPF